MTLAGTVVVDGVGMPAKTPRRRTPMKKTARMGMMMTSLTRMARMTKTMRKTMRKTMARTMTRTMTTGRMMAVPPHRQTF